jgi:hypothetical protein
MPRRWKAAIFLTTLLAATLSFATLASARTDHVTVLHFTARQVELHFVDVAPTGGLPSLGDTFVVSEDLYRDGHKVGFNGAICPAVRTQHDPVAFQCVATAHLDQSDLTVQGLAFQQPTNIFAITGGTGRWRNAGGQVVVQGVLQPTSQITAYISDLGQGHS